MRLMNGLLFCAAMTFPMGVQASVDAFMEDLSGMGLTASWSSAGGEGELSSFQDLQIDHEGLVLTARQVSYLPGESFAMQDVRITDAASGNGVEITLDALEAASPAILSLLRDPEPCAIDPASLQGDSLRMRNLSVRPISLIASRNGYENFDIQMMQVDILHSGNMGCLVPQSARMRGVSAVGADRSVTLIDDLSVAMRADPSGMSMASMEGRHIMMQTPVGQMIGTIGTLSVTVMADDVRIPLTRDVSLLMDQAMEMSSRAQISLHGLSLAAPGGAAIRGDVDLTFGHDGPDLDLDIVVGLSGFSDADISLGMRILPASQAIGLAAVAGDVPGLSVLERLALRHMRVNARDRGAMALVEQSRGVTRDAIMARLRGLMTGVSASIVDPLMDFVTLAIDEGAGFRSVPAEPVALTQIVMTGLLQPATLASLLAISAE